MVSATEGIVEMFVHRQLKAVGRWHGEHGSLSSTWDSCSFRFGAARVGDSASMTRAYDLAVGEFRRLRMRLRPGKAVQTTITATVDGQDRTVVSDVSGSDDAFELFGPIRGQQLSRLTVTFTAEQPGPHSVQLRWIMLEKEGTAWRPPERPFDGMIVEQHVGRFEPGLGLLLGADELERMRAIVATSSHRDKWEADLKFAASQYAVDPASMIRPYSLYAYTRYGRDTDAEIETIQDGIMLALVGMISRNEDYMRQAARHAVALAHIDEWSEGFVDRMPGYYWYHSGFAPNHATIKASLLLDWTWHYLTPEGRAFIREAIEQKGLPYLDRAKNAMANQGVRFNKGLILGRMAVANSLDEPSLRTHVRACIDRINAKLDEIIRPDGTFSEGMVYGKGTMASTPISYVAASRCLDVPVKKLVTRRMLPAMRFLMESERGLNAAMAAFCAGPLEDESFTGQCVPMGLLHSFHGADLPKGPHPGLHNVEYIYYGLASLWAPQHFEVQQLPQLPRFSVYRDGGWIFGGSDDPAEPRFSFESGLWDGHGHHWFHKNAVTLDGWGERLLVMRYHLGYQDARSQYTMRTKLYNTFAPSARNQNASGARGRGAKLLTAEDLGPVAVVQSDNATAWRSGVTRAVRSMLFLRPNVMVIHDDAKFEKAEPGVQSWNSFQPWEILDGRTCLTRSGRAAVRLTAVEPDQLELAAGEDSVSREQSPKGTIEVPVYRAAFTSPADTSHQLLTIIEAIAPDGDEGQSVVNIAKTGMIEIVQNDSTARIFPHPNNATARTAFGFSTDGKLLLVVSRDGNPLAAGALNATWLQGPPGKIEGTGFVHWSSSDP